MPNCSALDWLGTLVDVVACFLGICTVLWFSVVREGRGGGGRVLGTHGRRCRCASWWVDDMPQRPFTHP